MYQVKARFEKVCLKVESPKAFFLKFPTGSDEPDALNQADLEVLHKNMYYFDIDDDGNTTRHRFIKKWSEDITIRTYTRIVVDPQGVCPSNEYNMWRGFRVDKMPPVEDALVDDMVEVRLCASDARVAEADSWCTSQSSVTCRTS
jgi:hypothetical protein